MKLDKLKNCGAAYLIRHFKLSSSQVKALRQDQELGLQPEQVELLQAAGYLESKSKTNIKEAPDGRE